MRRKDAERVAFFPCLSAARVGFPWKTNGFGKSRRFAVVRRAEVRRQFVEFDSDGDGLVSIEEAHHALRRSVWIALELVVVLGGTDSRGATAGRGSPRATASARLQRGSVGRTGSTLRP